MRAIAAALVAYVIVLACAISGFAQRHDGQTIFRFDTFGDEQFWTDVLRMHEVIPTVDPKTALAVGLKVDGDVLPAGVIALLRAGTLDLSDPAVTLALLRLNAVVGVKGTFNQAEQLGQSA